jgi:hypothetical protein
MALHNHLAPQLFWLANVTGTMRSMRSARCAHLGEATVCREVGIAAAGGHGHARWPHAKALAHLAQPPVARTPDEVEESLGRFHSQGSSHAFHSTRHGHCVK